MYQKDYLLFMIEQFARLLRRIVSKIAGGDYDDATYEIEQVYRQYLGINSDLIPSFSFDSLMMLQSADPDSYHDRCMTMADMLRLEGEIFAKNGGLAAARGRYQKALGVYLTIFLDDSVSEERRKRYSEDHRPHIDTVLSALDKLEAPAGQADSADSPDSQQTAGLPETIQQLLNRYRASL